MTTYTNLSSESVDGVIESSIQGLLLGSLSTMPTASEKYEGCIVLYTGTTGTYTNSRFYQCTKSGSTYSWTELTVADSPSLEGYVPTSRKVAGHALTADVSISASDVGAVPTSRKINGNALTSDVNITLDSLNGVPKTRKVNSKALSSDITLDASDVSAIPSSYLSTAKPVSSSTDTQVPSSKAVYSAVSEVATAVSTEATTRGNADTNLQSQIDALTAKSDVIDIVGTYAELQAYPTSGLGDNDIIKVLSDSTHDNAMAYYRWSASTTAWVFVGTEGPYLTPSTAQATYVPKTTTVNGKALSGNVSLGASDVSAIPSSYLSTATPSETSTDSQVPTSKAVFDALSGLSVGYIIEVSVSLSTGSGSLSDIAITATASGYDTLTGTTDSSGFCSLKGAIAGVTYTVTGTKDTYAVTSATVKIEHLVNEVSISTYKYGQLTVNQTPVSGTVSITGGEYTQSGNVYFLVPGTAYTVAVSQVSGYVKPANQTVTLTAGQERTITFTHVAYPKVTVNQSGATGTISCSPTPFAVSGNVYTLLPETSYVFSVSQVSGYLKPANQTVSYNAGTTNTITFAHITLPKLTVSVTDPNKTSAITVSATNGTETVTGIVNASSGTGSVTLTVNYTGSYEISIPNPPTGGSATTVTATAVGGSTVDAGTIVVSYGFGFTIVQITEGTSDPYNRVSYPASVTINGKTYTNSIPSTGFTEARGTSLNGWAVADNACSKLIEGIRPVALNGSSWITSGYSLTDSTGWSSSYDWFTEFPFRWMAWYKTGSTVYIIFSDKDENPDSAIFQDYAFLNNSNVRKPNMHVGCFDGTNTSNVLYSKRTGANPTVNVSITNFIAYAKARGTDFDIITFYQVMYITGLFITLYKTTDCQGYSNSTYGLGKGRVNTGSVGAVNGVSFDNNYGMYGDRSGDKSQAVFFWIHDIWGNIYDFVGGAKTDSSRRLMTQSGKVSSVTDSDFNNTALTPSLSSDLSGYVTAVAGGQKTGPFPTSASGGSSTTYFSDYCDVRASYFPYWGGGYSNAGNAGLFRWVFNYSATEASGYIGSRLSYKGGRT